MKVALLTGRDKAAERRATLEGLGRRHRHRRRHACFGAGTRSPFRDLALAIVDEQHRFGVHQRLALGEKGEAVDVLVMTATPIPRTLVLTYFGDMDVSNLREAGGPADRHARLRWSGSTTLSPACSAIRRAPRLLGCPLVAETRSWMSPAAQDRFEDLQKHFRRARRPGPGR